MTAVLLVCRRCGIRVSPTYDDCHKEDIDIYIDMQRKKDLEQA